jgi:hypothetical protein
MRVFESGNCYNEGQVLSYSGFIQMTQEEARWPEKNMGLPSLMSTT